MTESNVSLVGTARVPIVLTRPDACGADAEVAVVTAVTARRRPVRPGSHRDSGVSGFPGGRGVVFSGPVAFDRSARRHIRETIWPAAVMVWRRVNPVPDDTLHDGVEIAVRNLEAAGVRDAGLLIEGYSFGLACFAAMVSLLTGIPLAQDVAFTGHLLDTDGTIGPVAALEAKVAAAARDRTVSRLVCPALDQDGSLSGLNPAGHGGMEGALLGPHGGLEIARVKGGDNAWRCAATTQSTVLAALRQGWYRPAGNNGQSRGVDCGTTSVDNARPVHALAGHLHEVAASGFADAVESWLIHGPAREARRLVDAFVSHHVQAQRYPAGFAGQLQRVLRSVPLGVRRRRLRRPLLSVPQAMSLSALAGASDHDDVGVLFELTRRVTWATPGAPPSGPEQARQDGTSVEAVVQAITPEALAEAYGHALDDARVGFTLTSALAEDHESFIEIITAYYAAMVRRVGLPVGDDELEDGAIDLVNHAFGEHGLTAAASEARRGFNGGLCHVINRMTERLKRELYERRVRRVIALAMDPMDWDQRVGFMAALKETLRPGLSDELEGMPPDRLVRRHEELIHAYVQSLEGVRQLLRTL
ncbi:MAG: S16 family serine protease [Planctomycetota bacterium]